jgi:cytochrome c-type biogenesis protein
VVSTLFLTATGSLDGISPPIAVLAGLVSFVSPCVLPLVPAYLAYLGSRAGQPVAVSGGSVAVAPAPSSLPVAAAGLSFVAGLSLIFILFFYVFSLVVQPIRAYVPIVAGVFVIVMALQVAGFIRIPFLMGEYRAINQAPRAGGGVAGGFVLGMGFASGWTPCIGVTLSAVLSSAVTSGTTAQGLGLMIAYCLGLGLPFVVLAFALESARPLVRLVNNHRRAIDLASAAILVVMGLLLLMNKLTILSAGLSQLVPGWPNPTL